MRLHLGHLRETKTRVELPPESLFGRHLAILGATGGGKSWSVARIVEETLQFRSKVVLFDPSGEYHTLRGQGVRHLRIGGPNESKENSQRVAVPYTELLESDLFAIFKPAGAVQATKLRAAFKSLKLASVSPLLSTGGMVMKAHRSKHEYEQEYAKHFSFVEDPRNRFDVRYLIAQIQNECVDHQRSAVEGGVWGGPNGVELSSCVPLMSRIQEIVNAAIFEPIFKPGELPSLFQELKDFFADPDAKLLCLSLENVSFQYRTREILSNAIGRYLLELARLDAFVNMPVLAVLDEAHQFLAEPKKDDEYPLESFGLIAKEGRKYALTLCLATQRPRDIPEDVLSQVGMMIVHRITSDRDRTTIERAVGGFSDENAILLPQLETGQALVIGCEYAKPILIDMAAPEQKPDSGGPDYQRWW